MLDKDEDRPWKTCVFFPEISYPLMWMKGCFQGFLTQSHWKIIWYWVSKCSHLCFDVTGGSVWVLISYTCIATWSCHFESGAYQRVGSTSFCGRRLRDRFFRIMKHSAEAALWFWNPSCERRRYISIDCTHPSHKWISAKMFEEQITVLFQICIVRKSIQ